jgi:hypothetical protein
LNSAQHFLLKFCQRNFEGSLKMYYFSHTSRIAN